MSGNGIRCFAQAVAAERGDLDDQLILHRRRRPHRHDVHHRRARHDRRHASTWATWHRSHEPDGLAVARLPSRPSGDAPQPGQPAQRRRRRRGGASSTCSTSVARFPQVNLEIVEPGPEATAITMRVHERGAGITEACGTGRLRRRVRRPGVGARGRRCRRSHRCTWTVVPPSSVSTPTGRPRVAHRPGDATSPPSRSTSMARSTGDAMTTPYDEALGGNADRPDDPGADRARRGRRTTRRPTTTSKPASTNSPCSSTRPAPTRSAGWCNGATRPTTRGTSARARPRN